MKEREGGPFYETPCILPKIALVVWLKERLADSRKN